MNPEESFKPLIPQDASRKDYSEGAILQRSEEYYDEEIAPYLKEAREIHEEQMNEDPHGFGALYKTYPDKFTGIIRRTAEKLMRKSHIDPKTGLLNKQGMDFGLKRVLVESRRSGKSFVVVYLDGNGFKQINDTHGHDVGDRVIVDTANSIGRTLRESDIVARFGGDEYAVILEGISNIEDAVKVISKIQVNAERDVRSRNQELSTFSVSAGIVGSWDYDLSETDAKQLLADADQALYATKQNPDKDNYAGLVRGNNIGVKTTDEQGQPMFYAIPRTLEPNYTTPTEDPTN